MPWAGGQSAAEDSDGEGVCVRVWWSVARRSGGARRRHCIVDPRQNEVFFFCRRGCSRLERLLMSLDCIWVDPTFSRT
jgi:hypothetical protein